MDLQKAFLGGLVLGFLFVSFLMVLPFVAYLFAAIILGFVMKPLQKRLEQYVPPSISAISLIISFFIIIAVPFGLATQFVVSDALVLVDDIDEFDKVDFSEIEQDIYELTGQRLDFQQHIQEFIEGFTDIAVGGFIEVVGILTSLGIGIMIMVFTLFYILRDGELFYKWLRNVTPVSDEIQDEVYSRAKLMTESVLKGHVVVALFEGLVGGFGLYLAGVPNFAFWTFVMIILCFIPVFGAFMVWIPASVYLVIAGNTFAGFFLFIYGVIIVSIIDNLMRPYLMDRSEDFEPAVILIGVIGGIYLFGAIGLFIGPIVFGMLKMLIEVSSSTLEN